MSMILALGMMLYFQDIIPILLIACLSFFFFFFTNFSFLQKMEPFAGYANWVSLVRLVLIVVIAVFYWEWHPSLLFFLTGFVIFLDGIDGYFARKFDQSTLFGEYLDMETDTMLVCVLCTLFYLDDKVGWWILVIGNMRYFYVSMIYLFQLQNKKEPHTRFAQTIAVILFISLLSPFLVSEAIYFPLLVVASILVTWSFGVSFFGLLK